MLPPLMTHSSPSGGMGTPTAVSGPATPTAAAGSSLYRTLFSSSGAAGNSFGGGNGVMSRSLSSASSSSSLLQLSRQDVMELATWHEVGVTVYVCLARKCGQEAGQKLGRSWAEARETPQAAAVPAGRHGAGHLARGGSVCVSKSEWKLWRS